jgi:hypothetical protein
MVRARYLVSVIQVLCGVLLPNKLYSYRLGRVAANQQGQYLSVLWEQATHPVYTPAHLALNGIQAVIALMVSRSDDTRAVKLADSSLSLIVSASWLAIAVASTWAVLLPNSKCTMPSLS